MEWQFIKNNPFIRLLIPFLVGIAVCYYVRVDLNWSIIALAASLLFCFISIIFFKKYTQRWITGFAFNLSLFFIAFIVTTLANLQSEEKSTRGVERIFRAMLLEPPSEKENGYKATLQVNSVLDQNEWSNLDFHLAVFFAKDSLVSQLKAGQIIEFETRLKGNSKQLNPFGFDYGTFLKQNGINGSVYLNTNDWKLIDKQSKGLKQQALNLRKYLVGLFEKAGIKGDELGLVSALVLGYQDQIGDEVKQAFRVVGASHILSVSGMHVGIIFIALEFLMKGFARIKQQHFKFIVIAIILWFYAFLTGLSPSVLRATVMFTFVLAGKMLNKPLNIYNSLAASAFFILLVNPYLMFNLGFQLSYIAVTGIVFFHPKIYHLLRIKNWFADKVWELTAVSIAAQIATLPLCLYYFKQFPTYFWLSNLFITPGSTLLIFMSIFLLFISPFAVLIKPVGLMTLWVAKLINATVVYMAKLPLSTIGNLPVEFPQMLLTILIIITVFLWLLKRENRYLIVSLACIFLIVFSVQYKKIENQQNKAFCVYYIPKSTAIQFVEGEDCWWVQPNCADSNKSRELIQNGNQYWGINQSHILDSTRIYQDGPIAWKDQFFAFDTLHGMLMNDNSRLYRLNKPVQLDYLVVCGQPTFALRDFGTNLTVRNLIIDCSTPPWIVQLWQNSNSKIPVHIINQQGAFIERIK